MSSLMTHSRAGLLHSKQPAPPARRPGACQPSTQPVQPTQEPLHVLQQQDQQSAAPSTSCGPKHSAAWTRTQSLAATCGVAATVLSLAYPDCAQALQVEPDNALSLPTWAIHVSSVVEWVIAMGLVWQYAEVTGNQRWKGLTWGMLPALGSATCACTWHFFYNSPDLEFLVALQALLTVVGNTTCLMAAYRIWEGARSESA